MSSGILPIPPRGKYHGSQLRYVSSGNDSKAFIEPDGKEFKEPSSSDHTIPQDVHQSPISLVCTLGIHDDGFSTDGVLLHASLFPNGSMLVDTPVQLLALEAESPSRSFKQNAINGMKSKRPSSKMHVPPSAFSENNLCAGRTSSKVPQAASYVFKAKDTSSEITSKHPNLEVHYSLHGRNSQMANHVSDLCLSTDSDCSWL